MSAPTPHLSAEHRKMLEQESGIRPEVIEARGYFTAQTKAELARLGFSRAQQLAPALGIPIRNPTGQIANHQIRPDNPRKVKKKGSDKESTLKYETLKGSRLSLDTNPLSISKLADPSEPLWITEGSKKVDALVTHGLCAVGLMGVWGWRGTNGHGGKVALPDWENIALNGRLVYLAFDSDVMTKLEVYKALVRLKQFLEHRKAKIKIVYLPARNES